MLLPWPTFQGWGCLLLCTVSIAELQMLQALLWVALVAGDAAD